MIGPARGAETTAATRVLLVTGMSGAGKSSALKVLEDLGYEAIDNIPVALLRRLLHSGTESVSRHGAMAVGIDIRTRDFDAQTFLSELTELQARDDLDVSFVFFDCDDAVIGRRYTETRRRHPLAEDRPLMDGVRLERELIAPLRERAGIVLDTTDLGFAELRQNLFARFRLESGPSLTVSVLSFSYSAGLPREADLVFDVRFLANPHYEGSLRPLSGIDAEVGNFIAADPAFQPFMDSLARLLLSLLPHYDREGKTYLTIAIGCTGGRHRSVFVAERTAHLLEAEGRRVMLRHRDLGGSEIQDIGKGNR